MKIQRYKIDILGISKARCIGSGKLDTSNNYALVYKGMTNSNLHQYGVRILLSPNLRQNFIELVPVNERILP